VQSTYPIEEAILGIDVGTTGCKTMLVDRRGQLVVEGESSYAVDSPRPGWAEQDVDAVLSGVFTAIRTCVQTAPRPITALCLGGALHSILPIGARDQPLMPALTWADNRAEQQAETIKQCAPALYFQTGCPAHPMYPVAKIRWLQEAAPDVFRSAARFVSVKEYVIHALTGQWLIDPSVASGSGLLNLQQLDWDDEALSLAGINRDRLSPLVAPNTMIGHVTPSRADELGLSRDVKVYIGASDAALSNVGAGAVQPGVIVTMIGSSGAIRTFAPQPILDPQKRTWCYLLDHEHYLVGGAINNGGIVLRWFADNFMSASNQDAYEALLAEAATVEPGAEGLIFLPFLAGERSPNWNPNARGVLFGLTLHHSRRHTVRAIIESVGYRLRSVLEPVEEVVGAATEIRASGGFLHSQLWTQILADILGHALNVPATPHTSALGAALWGWYAAGRFKTFGDIASEVPITKVIQPDVERQSRYAQQYDLYRAVYDSLRPVFTPRHSSVGG